MTTYSRKDDPHPLSWVARALGHQRTQTAASTPHRNQSIHITIKTVFPKVGESDENPSGGVQAVHDTLEIIPLAPNLEEETDLAT